MMSYLEFFTWQLRVVMDLPLASGLSKQLMGPFSPQRLMERPRSLHTSLPSFKAAM
jgi:hypothetical protein